MSRPDLTEPMEPALPFGLSTGPGTGKKWPVPVLLVGRLDLPAGDGAG